MSAIKKTKKKQSKEEKYKNLLEKIDLDLDDKISKDPKQALQQFMSNQFDQNNSEKLVDNKEITINDLMGRLDDNSNKNEVNNDNQKQKLEQLNQNASDNTQALRKQMEDLKRKTLLQEPASLVTQEQRERQANYSLIKDDMNKWIPIVKRNREAEYLDFTNKENIDNLRVNAVMGTDLQHPIAKAIESNLKSDNLESETAVKQKEAPLTKEQSKALKEKNLLFFKELKHKRVAKIKSKLYHKIKNRKKKRDQLNNGQEGVNIQELEEEQVKERIQQRHKTKGKNLRNLLKYGDKKSVQQTITSNSDMRKQILAKILQLDEQEADEEYDPSNDNAFRDKAIKELEKELMADDEGEQKKTGLKFMDDFNEKKKEQAMQEAKNLLQKLKESDNLEEVFSSDEEALMDEENEQQLEELDGNNDKSNNKRKRNKKNSAEEIDNSELMGRKIYKPNEDDKKKTGNFEGDIEIEQKVKKQEAGKILKQYLNEQEEKEYNNQNNNNVSSKIDNQSENVQKVATEQKQNNNKNNLKFDNSNLTQGINVGGLQDKYKKNLKGAQFDAKDLQNFDIENKEEIYKDLSNFNILVDNENEEEFLNEKNADYEKDIVQPKKVGDGWGSWAGQGIKKKDEPTPEQLLYKKKLLIEQIKKKREDGQLDNVIKRESRNKLVTQYLVKEIPHQYQNKEQYEFVNNAPVGSEWNTMRSTQRLIKPKIKTQTGQIINPIRQPKNAKSKF